MRIIGIDPAMTVTGYGVIDSTRSSVSLVEAGIIKTSPGHGLARRLGTIHKEIMALLGDTKPDVMVIEKLYAHYRHPTTAYILGHARGVICLTCALWDIPLVEYAATRIKKAIVGRGLASKYQVQRMVADTLGLKNLSRYSDVTDALALAIAHARIAGVRV